MVTQGLECAFHEKKDNTLNYALFKKISILKTLKSHPRFFISTLIGIAIIFLAPSFGVESHITKAIVGYDVGVFVYVAWAISLMHRSSLKEMQARALTQNDGKFAILFLVGVALVFSTCALFIDLSSVKYLNGAEKYEKLYFSVATIVLSWIFTHIAFALHYAHDYFFEIQHGRIGGLNFLPTTENPDYFDFLYFSFILGATAQTADIVLSSKKMRRTCLFHSILAFFFNTTLLALTVNMASGVL